MQRSGEHFRKAVEVVRSGKIGQVTFCRAWNYGNLPPEGFGNPPDQDPPADLDWDMWLGPAPERPYNPARFMKGQWRHFLDYGGSLMTDWGVHLLDIVQMAFGDLPPSSVAAIGSKYFLKDSRDYPDTFLAAYEYPEFAATYEYRFGNAQLPYDNRSYGILFHGTKASLFVDRSLYRIIPEKDSNLQPEEVKSSNNMNDAHWANFLACIKTRKRPVCDIETGCRTTSACLLGNVAWRSRQHLDWDSQNETTVQASARRFLTREYRAPWKLAV
jgi:predicted dehydrogenase